MRIQMYNFDEAGLIGLGNQFKEALVRCLVGEGMISEEDGREVLRHWAIVVKKKGWFGVIWDRFRNITEDTTTMEIMKACASTALDEPPDPPAAPKTEENNEQEEKEVSVPQPHRFDLETQ